MKDRLNFFEPWERLPANHENQLTRALLVVLRYCPIAHQAWLALIDRDLHLHTLPSPTFDTQKGTILNSKPQHDTNERIRGISVHCTLSAALADADKVVELTRDQVLDGIVRYGDELVMVLESKLGEFSDARQSTNINLHGQPIEFDASIRVVSWRDILATFADLASEGRNIVSGAERTILSDFLIFVSANFPHLGPFSNLARCGAEPSRIERRLRLIMSELLGHNGDEIPGSPTAITTAYLEYDSGNRQVKLCMYPGDTLQQARVLYRRPDLTDSILKLKIEGWQVLPNFHFGFMAKGFCWTKSPASLDEYMSFWLRSIANTTQVDRDKWADYWMNLTKEKIVDPISREQFDRDFTNTNRQSASPRPGLACIYSWPLEVAEELDRRGGLVSTVKERIDKLLESVGERKLSPA